MKSQKLTCIMAMIVFIELAIPLQLTAQHTRYTVTDLGTLGGTFSAASGMNNKGWVSGFSFLPGDTQGHAFLWKKGVMTDLGTLGGPFSSATDRISESGDISGFSVTSIPDTLEGGVKSLAFLWRKGVMTPLPAFNNAGGAEVNNRGQVVGTAEISALDPTCVPPRILQSRPVIWYRGAIQLLPTFPGDLSGLALGINDEGIAVGTSGVCTEVAHLHALLWENGALTDLGNLGGTINNEAVGVNNQRQVVGRSGLPGDATFHAFLWEDGAMTDLGTLPGDSSSFAININSKGEVVGVSCDIDGNCRGVLWQNGAMMDLNTLIPAGSDLFLLEADDVNDRGQIAGLAFQISTGEGHAFLATPVHASDSAALTAPGSTSQRPKVILPENVRQRLRQRMGFFRFLGTVYGGRASFAGSTSALLSQIANATSAVAATFSPNSLSFTQQLIGSTSAPKPVTLTNTGTGTLAVSSIAAYGNFKQTNNCPLTPSSLAPGAHCTINVTFRPSVSGKVLGEITVNDNVPSASQEVGLSGNGVTPLSFNPASLSLGSSSGITVTMTNNSSSPLTFQYAPSGDYFTGLHQLPSQCGTRNIFTGLFQGSLAGKASCFITVDFHPRQNGVINGAVTVTYNAPFSPVELHLSGSGTGFPTAPLTFSPTSLSFTSQLIGTTSVAKIVTVINSSSSSVTLNSISASGNYSRVASGTTPCSGGLVLAPTHTCTFSVTFNPSVNGKITGAVWIADSSTVSPQVLNVSGKAVVSVSLSPGSLNFGAVTVGTVSAAKIVTLTNNQSVPVTLSGIVASGDYKAAPSTCTGSIAAKSKCTFSVSFAPTASGTISGVVSVSYAASGSPQVVALTGTGQ